MAQNERPLSPHLQVYRLPLSAIISITHRITGVGLAFGALVLVAWLAAAAAGPAWFATASAVLGSIPGRIILFGFTWALFFHLANGIRHLFWDVGIGFDLEDARVSGYVVIGVSLLLAVAAFGLGCAKVAGL
ncbi:MAG: succinate dehydrogenase / fumarate reductase cytochrome b subunit [Alphaproteobacteria bacterium]|jgi:succinate dehydrogenase / fumarate reductase cytochrome b subunit